MDESYPIFISNDEVFNTPPHIALCKCPLPILPNGYYGHIVKESGKLYTCALCKTKFSLYFKEAKE